VRVVESNAVEAERATTCGDAEGTGLASASVKTTMLKATSVTSTRRSVKEEDMVKMVGVTKGKGGYWGSGSSSSIDECRTQEEEK
jgi:hypothetical protein